MRLSRPRAHLVGVALVLSTFLVSGCVKNDKTSLPLNPLTPTTPTPPPAQAITETFTGTLTVGGSQSFPFNTTGAGTVTGTLTSFGPDSPLQVGIGLGYWNGTSCSAALTNPSATQGGSVAGSVSGPGTFCAGVYDVGNLQSSMAFILTVTHP